MVCDILEADEWSGESGSGSAGSASGVFPSPNPEVFSFYMYFNLFNRQLDYNQISCIEDGAFRALRDLEVL